MVSKIDDAIQEAGSYENIITWCFPTPEQRKILYKPKIIFLSPWGSGKTMFMVWKSIELAKEKQKVLFILFKNGKSNKETLLYLDLEEKFEKYNVYIHLKSVSIKDDEENNLSKMASGFHHLMIDEFFGDFYQLPQKTQNDFQQLISSKEKCTVWIAMSNFSYEFVKDLSDKNIFKDSLTLEDQVKEWFPSFEISKINTPLRMPTNVTKHMQSQWKDWVKFDYNIQLIKGNVK